MEFFDYYKQNLLRWALRLLESRKNVTAHVNLLTEYSYDDAIAGAMLDATQRRRKAARAKLLTQFEIFEVYETSLKEKLEYIRKKLNIIYRIHMSTCQNEHDKINNIASQN